MATSIPAAVEDPIKLAVVVVRLLLVLLLSRVGMSCMAGSCVSHYEGLHGRAHPLQSSRQCI